MSDGDGKFVISVNGIELEIDEPVNGRRILAAAGFKPAEDHVLVQLLLPGTRSVGLDEPVDLKRKRYSEFRAFKSDRIFRFTIDGRGYVWGSAVITEPDLRVVAVVGGEEVLVLERDGKAVTLADDDVLKLEDAGTEHLRVVELLVTVYLNDDVERRIPRRSYKTEELVEVLGVEAGYVLDVLEDGQLKPLEPGQTTEVRDGMKFYSHVPAGGSS